MKKLTVIILAILGFTVCTSAQTHVDNLTMLQAQGYSLGQGTFLGYINGHNVYRANFTTNDRCKGKKKRCRQCPGCCNSGYVDYDETERIISTTNTVDGNTCTSITPIIGQMYYDADGDYITPNDQN